MIPYADENVKWQRLGLKMAAQLGSAGMPLFTARLKGNDPIPPDKWQQTKATRGAAGAWEPGRALCGVTGVAYDVLDIDPRNGGRESFSELSDELGDDGPDVYWRVKTPRGGQHLYISPLGIGTHHNFMPGLDLQGGTADGSSRAFVITPPTVRFGKVYRPTGRLIPFSGHRDTSGRALKEFIQSLPAASGQKRGDRGAGGRGDLDEIRGRLLAEPGNGGQRKLLLEYTSELERTYGRDGARHMLLGLLPVLKNYNPRKPWTERSILSGLHPEGKIIPDARPGELDGISGPRRAMEADEEEFWESRPVLGHIRDWAVARRASPWAVLGEALAEAICHTPPGLQLPPSVGGNGTLNMLIAMVGKSGAGKQSARQAIRAAINWHGILGSLPDTIPRIPLGSGEGLARNYGFSHRDKDTGQYSLERTNLSVITTIAEIDTFAAMHNRSGATISPELRKFYSGEDLGFGYSDPSKRVIIPEHSYRGCVIAGVQPGRGDVILGDMDGGFAQRWLWLPASDPAAPDSRPPAPGAMEWKPPGDWGADDVVVMKVCDEALNEIDDARLAGLRERGADEDSHALYTREKVAAGLALLDERCEISASDWELSAVVMKVSARTRTRVSAHLQQKAHEGNVARGKAEGIRSVVAEDTKRSMDVARVGGNVLRKLNADSWTAASEVKNSLKSSDRELLVDVYADLLERGVVESKEDTYRGRPRIAYRRVK